jgi:uncharacterized protein (DUF302 family)
MQGAYGTGTSVSAIDGEYGFSREVAGEFDEIVEQVRESLKTEGFGA